MSLAQRVERPHPPTAEARAPGPAARVAVPVDFRDITRRPVGGAAAPDAPVAVALPVRLPVARVVAPPADHAAPGTEIAAEPMASIRRDSELALELLSEVSTALPILMGRCEDLEIELAGTIETARAEVEAANELAHEWQQIASALKGQVDGLEKGLRVMKQRAEAAELKASSLRDETQKSQHAAAEAECLSSLFQEKVISSFGVHSLMHPILEAFRSKGAPQVD